MQTSAVDIKDNLKAVAIEDVRESPWNPRKYYDETSLGELADNIKTQGIIVPLIVRPKGDFYEIAAGHRRYRAAKRAGLHMLPVIIREMDDQTFREQLTIENIQREDIHELDEARGYFDLIQHHGYNAARVATQIGKSSKYVWDRLKLIGLIADLQDLFYAKGITAGHAILLARLSKERQQHLFTLGLAELSVRALAKLVREKVEDPLYFERDKEPEEDRGKKREVEGNYREAAAAILQAAQSGDASAREAISYLMSEMGRIGGIHRIQRMTKAEIRASAQHARKALAKKRRVKR